MYRLRALPGRPPGEATGGRGGVGEGTPAAAPRGMRKCRSLLPGTCVCPHAAYTRPIMTTEHTKKGVKVTVTKTRDCFGIQTPKRSHALARVSLGRTGVLHAALRTPRTTPCVRRDTGTRGPLAAYRTRLLRKGAVHPPPAGISCPTTNWLGRRPKHAVGSIPGCTNAAAAGRARAGTHDAHEEEGSRRGASGPAVPVARRAGTCRVQDGREEDGREEDGQSEEGARQVQGRRVRARPPLLRVQVQLPPGRTARAQHVPRCAAMPGCRARPSTRRPLPHTTPLPPSNLHARGAFPPQCAGTRARNAERGSSAPRTMARLAWA